VTVKPDIARLEHLLAWATEEQAKLERGEPSEWNQGVYLVDRMLSLWPTPKTSCNTVCCIAGKVALEDGAEIIWNDGGYGSRVRVLGSRIGIDDYAQQELGLTNSQAFVLFHAENNLEALRKIIDAIKRGVSDKELQDLHQELLEQMRWDFV
jgi:hypothetical protein